ncbi:unnamed protein product [Leptosia nina]|uniref:Uncharacterized protein n=1 Tax=Leptosia nina TaxID=320188 RepID=A0AAV1JGV1_9NEOP
MTSKSCTGSDPHVTRRLCATLIFLIGILCVFAGYLFGRMARNEVRHGNDVVSSNLTFAAENLFRKAKRISPKAVHHNDSGKISRKILDIFHCNAIYTPEARKIGLRFRSGGWTLEKHASIGKLKD